MTICVDSSVFLIRYVKESDSDAYTSLLLADPEWVSARHTEVDVRRTLARLLSGPDLEAMRSAFASDWRRASVVDSTRRCALVPRISSRFRSSHPRCPPSRRRSSGGRRIAPRPHLGPAHGPDGPRPGVARPHRLTDHVIRTGSAPARPGECSATTAPWPGWRPRLPAGPATVRGRCGPR